MVLRRIAGGEYKDIEERHLATKASASEPNKAKSATT
jgi:hypothetical protein